MNYKYVDKFLYGYNQGCVSAPRLLECFSPRLAQLLVPWDIQHLSCSSLCISDGALGGYAVPIDLHGAMLIEDASSSRPINTSRFFGQGSNAGSIPEEEQQMSADLTGADVFLSLIGWFIMILSSRMTTT